VSWLLRFDGVNDGVTLSSDLSLTSVGDYIEMDVDIDGSDEQNLLGGNTFGSFDNVFSRQADGKYRFRVPASGTVQELTPTLMTGRFTLKLERVSAGYELFQNGVSAGVLADTGTFSPRRIGVWAGGSNAGRHGEFDLYGLVLFKSGAVVSSYDPSASSGTGSTLTDTVGSNNGTLTGFPTDDSQWVSYSTTPTLGTITTASITSNSVNFSLPVTF